MISYRFKLPGLLLIFIGIVLTVIYSIQKIDISIPVFAVGSFYLESKFFVISENNIFDELIVLSFLFGFLFTAFSKEKVEKDNYKILRGEAWQKAIFANMVFLLFIVLFIFGIGFVVFLIVNLFSSFILYHLFFWLKKRKHNRQTT